ncbi:MAG: CBS domain-containing protein [Oscillospiraceae bacterium]
MGILDIKDYFALPERSAQAAMAGAVKEPYLSPSIKADVLFRRMREGRLRIAVVLDEYGGVTGIVTLSDLLELLVGDLDCCENETKTEGN